MARGYRQEIVGIMHLVIIIDGDNLETTRLDILHKGLVFLQQRISQRTRLTGPDVACIVLWCARLRIQSAAHHRTEVFVDDVKVGIQVHLHLPPLMVAHHDYRIMPEGISLHHLLDSLIVGAHTAADERDSACRDIVATLQSSVTADAQDGLQSQMLVAYLDDVRLGCALAAVHIAYYMPTRRGDALVASEIQVHQRILDILRLIARIVVRPRQLHRRLKYDAAVQVLTTHL